MAALCVALLRLLVVALVAALASAANATEADELLAFKASFANGETVLASWNGSDACSGWTGVSCSGGHVKSINLCVQRPPRYMFSVASF